MGKFFEKINTKQWLASLSLLVVLSIICNVLIYKKIDSYYNELQTTRLLHQKLNSDEKQGNQQIKIKAYLVNNPQLVIDKKIHKQINSISNKNFPNKINNLEDILYSNLSGPILGNPEGKHIAVLFNTYQCEDCIKVSKTLDEWLASDPEAKIVVKEYPINTEQPSARYAATMITALYFFRSDLYQQARSSIQNADILSNESIDKIISDLGVNLNELNNLIPTSQEHIEKNHQLAQKLKILESPTLFVKGIRTDITLSSHELQNIFLNK